MKKMFCFFMLAVSALFADEVIEPSHQQANITYFKMGGSFIPNGERNKIGPTFTFGERFQRDQHAIDLSIGGAWFNKSSYLALPKLMYLYYFDSSHFSSLYAGGGLSYGNIKNKINHKKFEGILVEAAIGYEWMRNTSIRTFTELNISQGAIPLTDKHHYMTPIISVSFGVGF